MARRWGPQGPALLVAVLLSALPARAVALEQGGLMGWVEDSRGVPVSGALISLFGRGTGRSGLVTFSDDSGRFFVPSLPAGSYTLRALGRGHRPAPARQVTVLPNQASIFSISLSPLGELSAAEQAARTRELEWLLRHKPRSVLEDTGLEAPAIAGATSATAPPGGHELLGLAGSLEFAATPAALGFDGGALGLEPASTSYGLVRFAGPLADSGRWSVGGMLAESGGSNWRMAGDFALPLDSHELELGAGYGTPVVRPLTPTDRGFGADGVGSIFARHRWDTGRVVTRLGARYSYVGYLADTNHVDPSAELEIRAEGGALFRSSLSFRTLAPAGNPLVLSTLSMAPRNVALMDPSLRAERVGRFDVSVDRAFGPTSLAAFAFYEGADDQLVNAFGAEAAASGALRIVNAGRLAGRGIGLSVGRSLKGVVHGSVTYTYGRSRRDGPVLDEAYGPLLTFSEADYHDLVTRLETVFERFDTRLTAYYRLNALNPETQAPQFSSRFDLQLRQGLPFLGGLTRADWDLLLAYRNLFYEEDEGATLDELTVVNPPRRVVGGVSVRF